MIEYRVDIYTGSGPDGTPAGCEYYAADGMDQALDTARQIVRARGGDYGDIYEHNGVGGALYYDTVEVD